MSKPWVTKISIAVLSMGPVSFENLRTVSDFIELGSGSGRWEIEASHAVPLDIFLGLCDEHATDPEFFGLEGR